MVIEEEFNMLNKRIHLQNPVSAALDFLGYVEFDGKESGLTHRYTGWCYNYLEGNRGIYYFGDKEIVVERGCGLLIPPFQKHHLLNPGPETLHLAYMGFSFNGGGAVGAEDIDAINGVLRESCYTKSFHEKLHGLFRQMKIAGIKGGREILMANRVMILENLLELYDFSHGRSQSAATDSDAFLLQDIKNIISHNFSRNISLQEISKALYVSPRKLTTKFLELTGMSFKEYTQMLKMEQASRLLYTSGKSVSEIAEELGFCDIHYFSRRFKLYYGCPPNALRSKGRGGQE
ncbi:AraC family transcriptional regulator [Oscillibacter sp.]|uniref:AraC family transcriptional regulator n=1 Tax=Oscillibacter sp. TaxID=1945593 RepID=UPI00261EB8A2|nr:AraC family transcriptional regulator [Oscillibacter sp.]MDD3347849.1 AraC family transcriptional regulator [Oscillibacter sp.]